MCRFYSRCAEDDVALARARLVPEPVAVSHAPVSIDEARFGRIPRYYVECLRDRAIPVEVQRAMVAASPCHWVFTLDTDHSPFFSAPEGLAGALIDVAEAAKIEEEMT